MQAPPPFFKYSVVKFWVVPFEGIDDYVIVPETWILWHDSVRGTYYITYPEEDPLQTNVRIQNNESHSLTWKAYTASVLHKADTYEEAMRYIREQKENSVNENLSQSMSNLNVDPKTPKSKIVNRYIPSPEHNPIHLTWTLKHPELQPGLIELIPGSKAFIDQHQLHICLEKADNCKKLARLLMKELFTDEALHVCSLTGIPANPFDYDGAHVRPGLHPIWKVIVEYVESYGSSEGWDFNSDNIRNAMQNELRLHRGIKKEEE